MSSLRVGFLQEVMMAIVVMVCGIYWMFFGLIQNTNNLRSSIVYKVLPFFTGMLALLVAMDWMCWINISGSVG